MSIKKIIPVFLLYSAVFQLIQFVVSGDVRRYAY